jgi:hypothetical protein
MLCVAIKAASVMPHDGDQRLEDPVGGVRIEIARGLVGEQQPRRIGDRDGHRNALLLAARRVRRAVIEALA